jgi:hypothetical protein
VVGKNVSALSVHVVDLFHNYHFLSCLYTHYSTGLSICQPPIFTFLKKSEVVRLRS